MKKVQLFLMTCALLTFGACKTQEDIRREKVVESLNEEVQQTKKNTASGNNRLLSIEEQLSKLSGLAEEQSHQKAQLVKDNQALNERIVSLEESNKKQVEFLKALTEKVNNQSGYIEEVIASIAKLSEKPSSKKKTVNHDSVEITPDPEISDVEVPITFDSGMKKFRAKDYDEAKEIFLKVSENKKASKKSREGAIHHLGVIEFKKKNYDAAKVHFSKVFTDNPDSSFAPASLLQLGKTFKALKSNEEASMTFDELLNRFPKSKEAQEATKLK